MIAELIEQRPARGNAIDAGGGAADHGGHLLPPWLEKWRRHHHANADGAIKREAIAKRCMDIAAAVIERRHVDTGDGHGDVGHPAARRLGALAPGGEVHRFPQTGAANQAEDHGSTRAQVPAAHRAQRLERGHAVERAEVRHNRVEAFRMIERIEKLRQLLQAARQDADAVANAGSSQPPLRPAQHLFRWIARDHAGADGGEKLGVQSGAAANLEDRGTRA